MAPKDVYVNRTLNLRKIQYIGFDMDHTLVRYHSQNFEKLTHKVVLEKLINRKYPSDIRNLPFDYDRCIRGLVIDRRNGNILKLNRYTGIRHSCHGLNPISYADQKKLYKSIYIDLGDPNYLAIDTSFSISLALVFGQLVDQKDLRPADFPSYEIMSRDIEECVDEAHRDGSLKSMVKSNMDQYIIKDPELVACLERYKKHGKKLFVLTNSHFDYMKLLLDYAITPFLKNHKSWVDIFDYVICAAQKPRFFWDKIQFLKVDSESGLMSPIDGPLPTGVYYGGCASIFTKRLGISGEDILYVGDHIYGDIVRLKKDCNWRTALVIEEMGREIEQLVKSKSVDQKILDLMAEKEPFEEESLNLVTTHKDTGAPLDDIHLHELQKKISDIDQKITKMILSREAGFNKFWGEVMRIGNEESFFAQQVERYACVYTMTLTHLLRCSPRTYFRAHRRLLPHERGL